MDVLAGLDLQRYQSGALHTPRIPRTVYTADDKMFKQIDERNREQMGDFSKRRKKSKTFDKLAGFSSQAGGGDAFAAMPRFYSPLTYWEQTQIPYDINNKKHRFELYKWLDLFYRTHYLIPILVDIFTRFPLVGIDLYGPDEALNDFYRELFFDRMDYEQFLVDLGREYWTLGQSFPMGSFNETLGVWESEELIDPTLVEVKRFPIIGGEEFFIVPPKELVDLVKNRRPAPQYALLEKNYPDLIPFLVNGRNIPISNVLMKQVAFKASPRDLYGTPILLRALRTLMHEEKLMASQDAIAERLYSPLILAKLGVQDMGQGRMPWVPGPPEIQAFRNDLDLALSSDFRVIVHHFGVDIQNVFGREQMPRLGDDFDRIEKRLMQTFGVNPNLLSGGNASTPYASSALQAEFLNQILRTYQNYLKKHYIDRAMIVAEAQQHYAYEKNGDTRIPIYEEVLVYDEEGNQRIEKRKKLMIPEMRMKTLDLRDEATQRQFLQALKQQGVPIPDQDITMGMHYVFPEALAKVEEELIAKTVAQQSAKLATYQALVAKNLPVPGDLLAEMQQAGFAPVPENGGPGGPSGGPGGGMPGMPGGGGGGMPPGGMGGGGASPGGGIEMPPPPPDLNGPGATGQGTQPSQGYSPTRGNQPEQSTERPAPRMTSFKEGDIEVFKQLPRAKNASIPKIEFIRTHSLEDDEEDLTQD
jgi:hypothetical protein